MSINPRAATARENARRSDGKFGNYALEDIGTDSDLDMAFLDEDSKCPACGELIDYCQGHGSLGDPSGAAILDAHDDGDHSNCHPSGCDEVGEGTSVDKDISDFQLDVEKRGERTEDILRIEMLAEGIDEEVAGHVLADLARRGIGDQRNSTDGMRTARILDAADAMVTTDRAKQVQAEKERGEGIYQWPARTDEEIEMNSWRSDVIESGSLHRRSVDAALGPFQNKARMRRLADGSVDYCLSKSDLAELGDFVERTQRYQFADNSVTDKIAEGSRSPWGKAQHVDHPAPGIAAVSCAQHGGIKLSAARNKDIPEPLRNARGWYEEDAESYIVSLYHPEAAPAGWIESCGGLQGVRDDARAKVKDYFPDGYEQATGTVLEVGESYSKDRQTWAKEHVSDLTAVSAITADEGLGLVDVTVRRGGRPGAGERFEDAEQRVLRIPKEVYDDPANKHALGKYYGSFVFDEKKHPYTDVTPEAMRNPVKWVKPAGYTGMAEPKTDAARRAVAKDLHKQFRAEDGSVYSVGDKIAAGKIDQKRAFLSNGRMEYSLWESTGESEGYSYQVSKATYDVFEAPERRSEKRIAHQQMRIAEEKASRAASAAKIDFRSDAKRTAWKKAKAASQAARERYQAIPEDD